MEARPSLRFYDDQVRECLSELAGDESMDRIDNLAALLSDSNLGDVLSGGAAYGEPVDSYLRRIQRITLRLGPSAPGTLLDNLRYRKCQRLAARALREIAGRPLGTLVGSPLPPAGR